MVDNVSSNSPRQTDIRSQSARAGGFEEVNKDVKALIAKYTDTKFGGPSRETLATVEKFNKLWNPLEKEYRENPSKREKTLGELEKLYAELADKFTRSPAFRQLERPNRLDTPQEQAKVKIEVAKTKERMANNTKKAIEIQRKWDSTPGLEMRYRLLKSDGQGSDYTIQSATKEFLDKDKFTLLHDYLVYAAPEGSIKELEKQINLQLERNNLSQDTKKLLGELSKKLGFN